MRVNEQNKTMDMEARDINYILPAYLRQYLYASKNEDPVEIIFPMFPAAPHPVKPGVLVPIRWIAMDEKIVADIAADGSNIPEVTKEQEEVLDAKDEEIKKLKTQVSQLLQAASAIESPAKAAIKKLKATDKQPDRLPKMPPGGDIGSGHPDDLGSRDIKLVRQISSDLMDEPNVEEEKEIPTEIEKPQ